MKLTTITHVSLDGVMQGLGGADEDRRGGFDRGGWALPFFDAEGGAAVSAFFQRADAFLFGRWTFDVFAAYWGAVADPDNPIAAALNGRPKYVATSSTTPPTWVGTTVLGDDLDAEIRGLRAGADGEIQVHGSGTLVRWLLGQGLVDEINLLVYPVVLGQGRRLFPDNGPDAALELVASRATASGVLIQTYRPGGRPGYAA